MRTKTQQGALTFVNEITTIRFKNGDDSIVNQFKDDKVSTEPIKFGVGRYTIRRSALKQARGEETLWKSSYFDSDKRAQLVNELRQQMLRRRVAVDNSCRLSSADLRRLYRNADERPALYRYLLLRQLASGRGLGSASSELVDQMVRKAIDEA